jgi:hypothetical protein
MATPCGLTQEKLDAHELVKGGYCSAPFRNNEGEIQTGCGEPYANHPSADQGKEQFFLPILFNRVCIYGVVGVHYLITIHYALTLFSFLLLICCFP